MHVCVREYIRSILKNCIFLNFSRLTCFVEMRKIYSNNFYSVVCCRLLKRKSWGLNSIVLTLFDHSMHGAKGVVLIPITDSPRKSNASRAPIIVRIFIIFARVARRDAYDSIGYIFVRSFFSFFLLVSF